MTHQNLQIRIIRSERELINGLRLRHRIYKNAYPLVERDDDNQLEYDVYDSHSIHLGLYSSTSSGSELIGYCRFILPMIFSKKYAHLMIGDHELFKTKVSKGIYHLHLMEGMPLETQASLMQHLQHFVLKNQPYIEVSRFILHTDYRTTGAALSFVSAMFAMSKYLDITHCLIACSSSHTAIYSRMGLTPFHDIQPYLDSIIGPRYLIYGGFQNLNAVHLPKVLEMCDQFSRHQFITLI